MDNYERSAYHDRTAVQRQNTLSPFFWEINKSFYEEKHENDCIFSKTQDRNFIFCVHHNDVALLTFSTTQIHKINLLLIKWT